MIATFAGDQYEIPDVLIDEVYKETHIADPTVWGPKQEEIVATRRDRIATWLMMVVVWQRRGADLDEEMRGYLRVLTEGGAMQGFPESAIERMVAETTRGLRACRARLRPR
jgi:hypothetical protein